MMETVTLLTILLALVCQSTSQIEEECVYAGNMCNIHPKRCLENRFWRQCRSMSYPALYATGGPVELWVNITDFTTYPANFTMSVVRMRNGTMTAMDNCCNLRINESCTLHDGFSDKFAYMLFAPTQEGEYCSRKISARPGIHPKWCKLNISKPCLVLEDGIIGVDFDFKSISTNNLAGRNFTDYCFFNAPKVYGRRGRLIYDRLSVDVEGIALEDTRVRGEDFQTNCTVVENKPNLYIFDALPSNKVPTGFTRCAFTRMRNFSSDWNLKPICITTGQKSSWSTGLIAGVASVTFLVLVIIPVLVCRKYMKGYFPSYNVSVGEVPRVLDNDTSFTSLDKNSMTVMTKINEDCDNSQEESVRYLKSFPNPSLPSSDGFEKVFVILPEKAPQLHDQDSSQGDADNENSTTVLNDRTVNDHRVSSAETAVPPPGGYTTKHHPSLTPKVQTETKTTIPLTDGLLRKEYPSLMPRVRMENTQTASKTCEDDETTCSSTTDLNDNDTDKVALSSESIEEKNSTLNADNNFNYVSKSSLF